MEFAQAECNMQYTVQSLAKRFSRLCDSLSDSEANSRNLGKAFLRGSAAPCNSIGGWIDLGFQIILSPISTKTVKEKGCFSRIHFPSVEKVAGSGIPEPTQKEEFPSRTYQFQQGGGNGDTQQTRPT